MAMSVCAAVEAMHAGPVRSRERDSLRGTFLYCANLKKAYR